MKSFYILLLIFVCGIVLSIGAAEAEDRAKILDNAVKKTGSAKVKKACQFKVGWTEWKPYQYLDDNGKLAGLQVQLLKLIEQEIGCRFEFHKMNWLDSVQAIKSGQLDFIGNASKNEERQKFAIFSDPYRQDLVVLYIRSENKRQYGNLSLADLFTNHQFKLGMVKGSVYAGNLAAIQADNQYQNRILYVDRTESLFDMLVAGEIDGYFEDPLIFDHSLTLDRYSVAVESYPIAIQMGSIHFMFSKKNIDKKLVKRFNQALAKIRIKHRDKFDWF